MKKAKDYLDEANQVVNKIDVNSAIEKHKNDAIVFKHEFIIQSSIILKNIRFIVFFLLIYII